MAYTIFEESVTQEQVVTLYSSNTHLVVVHDHARFEGRAFFLTLQK